MHVIARCYLVACMLSIRLVLLWEFVACDYNFMVEAPSQVLQWSSLFQYLESAVDGNH